jgi:hypothetical protein
MYITSKISISDFKMFDNLIVSPDTSTVYGEQAVTDLTTESGSFWIEAADDCLRAISDGIISDECHNTNCDSYVQI